MPLTFRSGIAVSTLVVSLASACLMGAVVGLGWRQGAWFAGNGLPPVAIWLLWMPPKRRCDPVALTLLALYTASCVALLVAVTMWTRLSAGDVFLVYGPATIAILLIGLFRRTVRRAPPTNRLVGVAWRGVATVVLGLWLAYSGILVPALQVTLGGDGVGAPRAQDVPMPRGVQIAEADGNCGANGGFCASRFTVGSPGIAGTELVNRIATHWQRLGWSADVPCLHQGMVDPVERCWFVMLLDTGKVQVLLQNAVVRPGQAPATSPG